MRSQSSARRSFDKDTVGAFEPGKLLRDRVPAQWQRRNVEVAAFAELLEPEAIRHVGISQEIIAVVVEEQVLPGLDEVDPPQPVLPVQQYRHEACHRPRLVATA